MDNSQLSVKWGVKRLDKVCTLFTDGNWIESKDQSPKGIRLIQTGNVGNGNFKNRREKARWVSFETFERLKCQEVFSGDCLVSRLPDPVGRACIIPETGDKMITAVDCSILRFNSELVLSDFFNYYSQSTSYLNDVENQCTGATRKRISRKNLGAIEIPLPPLLEQKRIVEFLDEAFAGISLAVANAEKNLANTRELFESYLNNVFFQKGDDWVEKRLGDVCQLFQGLAINKKTKHLLVSNSILPLLRIKDLRTNTEEQFVAESGYPPNALVNERDIIYTRTGNSLGLVFRGRIGVLHNNSFKVTPVDLLENSFLFWRLQEPLFKNKIFKLASRAAQPDISHANFKEQKIYIPPLEVQKDIVVQIEKIKTNSKVLESIYRQKLTALDELKQSILQKAFSGQLTNTIDKDK